MGKDSVARLLSVLPAFPINLKAHTSPSMQRTGHPRGPGSSAENLDLIGPECSLPINFSFNRSSMGKSYACTLLHQSCV